MTVTAASESWDALLVSLGVAPRPSGEPGNLLVSWFSSPLGPLLAGATAEALCLLEFSDPKRLETQLKALRGPLALPIAMGSNAIHDQTKEELDRYFRGETTGFSVPTARPGTAFQQRVWDQLLQIPYGETRSYQDLAHALGSPGAVRAVGHANAQNRLAIVVPCHRVVNKGGGLGGYGGGLPNKRRLLELEQSHRPKALGGLFASVD